MRRYDIEDIDMRIHEKKIELKYLEKILKRAIKQAEQSQGDAITKQAIAKAEE